MDSDIDVLVVVDTNDWRFHTDLVSIHPYMDRVEKKLSNQLGREVSITRMPRLSRWESFITHEGTTKEDLIKKSIWLYDDKRISAN